MSLSIPEFSPWEDAEDRGQIAPGQAMILWAQSVQQHGFVLMSEDHGRDRYVVDCDASRNRQQIVQLQAKETVHEP